MTHQRRDDMHDRTADIAATATARASGPKLLGSWLLLAVISWLVTGALVSGIVWFARWLAGGP